MSEISRWTCKKMCENNVEMEWYSEIYSGIVGLNGWERDIVIGELALCGDASAFALSITQRALIHRQKTGKNMGVNIITAHWMVAWFTCEAPPLRQWQAAADARNQCDRTIETLNAARTVCSIAHLGCIEATIRATTSPLSDWISTERCSIRAHIDRETESVAFIHKEPNDQMKTALNFKHFESRREGDNMPYRFGMSAFMVVRSKFSFISLSISLSLPLSRSLCVFVSQPFCFDIIRDVDSFVADRVCVCFYPVNFPTFATLRTHSKSATLPFSAQTTAFSRCENSFFFLQVLLFLFPFFVAAAFCYMENGSERTKCEKIIVCKTFSRRLE